MEMMSQIMSAPTSKPGSITISGVMPTGSGARSANAFQGRRSSRTTSCRRPICASPAMPRALLLAIASNLARDALRRARRAGGSAGISSDPHELPFEPDQYEQLLLKQLILALPPPYREVFLLSRFTAMTYEDIARHCGISVKTVEWRMSKALALCNQALGR
jgi:DNA-directed RNA polymerase specialized sigma24 family protein